MSSGYPVMPYTAARLSQCLSESATAIYGLVAGLSSKTFAIRKNTRTRYTSGRGREETGSKNPTKTHLVRQNHRDGEEGQRKAGGNRIGDLAHLLHAAHAAAAAVLISVPHVLPLELLLLLLLLFTVAEFVVVQPVV